MYSDSVVEVETMPWCFDDQLMAEELRMKIYPEVDLAEETSPAQSASVYVKRLYSGSSSFVPCFQ